MLRSTFGKGLMNNIRYIVAIIAVSVAIIGCGHSSDPTAPHHTAVDALAKAMCVYRGLHGSWPHSLTNLSDQSITSFRGNAFEYNPTNRWLTLPVSDIPAKPDVVHRLTFGYFGAEPKVCAVGADLEAWYEDYQQETE